MSGAGLRITLFGGSGFIGGHLVCALHARGMRVRVVSHLSSRHQGGSSPGETEMVTADLRSKEAISKAVEGSSVIVNLMRIRIDRSAQLAAAVEADGAVARAAAESGARMIYMSAIGADPESPALYARWKGHGEKTVRRLVLAGTILRPSVVFGPKDNIVNRFAAMARKLPFLPLVGGGRSRMQPVYVGDVVAAIVRTIDDPSPAGATYELGGPNIVSLRELLEFIFETIGRRPPLVPIPYYVAGMLGFFLQHLPRPPLTVDQVRLLMRDNIVSDGAKRDGLTLQGLGIAPKALAEIVPGYLLRK